MPLDIFHGDSLVRPKVHNSYIPISQSSSQYLVLRAHYQIFLSIGIVEYAPVNRLEGVRAFDDLHFFCFFANNGKIMTQHLKLSDCTVRDFQPNFAWHHWFESLLQVDILLHQQFEKVSIDEEGEGRMETMVDAEIIKYFSDLLIVHGLCDISIYLYYSPIYCSLMHPISMLNKSLRKYEDLPIMCPSEPSSLSSIPSTSCILYYDQLIIDASHFSHPGTHQTMKPWIGKDIVKVFNGKSHSFNAKLMLMNLAIGRKSQKQGEGYQLYKQLRSSKMALMHEKMINQLDLSKGVLAQISKYSEQQIQALINIPKYFANSHEIMFKDTKWEEFFWKDRFWVSTTVFTLVIVSIVSYLYANQALLNTFNRICLFFVGICLWTIIEYYFHRIKLHIPIKQGMILNPHYVHHAFPNLKNKLALSINKNLLIELVALMIMVWVFQMDKFNALHIILGLHLFLTLYDVLHYYFHFGPELNLPFISSLKKNHMKHHYRDSNRGFGVTTTFWDWVFGTQHIIN